MTTHTRTPAERSPRGEPVNVEGLTNAHLIALFAAHCECNPINIYRTEDDHSHDCDTGILTDIQIALQATDEEARSGARCRCAALWNENLTSAIYGPLLARASLQECSHNMPREAGAGHWRDWHRGHGCQNDPDALAAWNTQHTTLIAPR